MPAPPQELHYTLRMNPRGVLAELRAVGYLRRHGYRVRHLRWRGGGCEIDVIARQDGLTVFVEVKSAPRLGSGARRVDAQKIGHLRRAAEIYLRQHGETVCRFDILEESDAGFRLIRDAFK